VAVVAQSSCSIEVREVCLCHIKVEVVVAVVAQSSCSIEVLKETIECNGTSSPAKGHIGIGYIGFHHVVMPKTKNSHFYPVCNIQN